MKNHAVAKNKGQSTLKVDFLVNEINGLMNQIRTLNRLANNNDHSRLLAGLYRINDYYSYKEDINKEALPGLIKLHLKNNEPVVNKGWRVFLTAPIRAFNRFFSAIGWTTLSFENVFTDYCKKHTQLSNKLGAVNPEQFIIDYAHKNVIYECYKIDENIIKNAEFPTIIKWLEHDEITLDHAKKLFSGEKKEVIVRLYENSFIIKNKIDYPKLAEHIKEKTITPSNAIKAYPSDPHIIKVAYKIDPMAIKYASSDIVLELMNRQEISPEDAVNTFPDDELIIKSADYLIIKTQDELIDFINSGVVDPNEAAQQYSNNEAVITAAYKKNPFSLKHADLYVINKLGGAQVVTVNDVLTVFSMSMPTDNEIKQNKTQFDSEMVNKNWVKITEICNKFWFEKPAEANIEDISKQLIQNKQWDDLYQLGQAYKKEDYKLIYGPLVKSPETTQLEQLARKMMNQGNFNIQNMGGDDYFVFLDGTQFNWTKIQANADWQHVVLEQSDFDSYQKFIDSADTHARSTLEANLEDTYRIALYTDPKNQKLLDMPDNPINFQEMQALNLYTGVYYDYAKMNGLMRNDKNDFDYNTESPKMVRSVLVHSVMAASGLRRAPMTSVTESYRRMNDVSNLIKQEYIEAAAKKGVVELKGFLSSSIEKNFVQYKNRPIVFIFEHLRGMYLAPISQDPDEKEYLIPPTQIQITDYKIDKKGHQFKASLVDELRVKEKQKFKPMLVTRKAADSVLRFAHPKQAISSMITFKPQIIELTKENNDQSSSTSNTKRPGHN